MVNCMLHALELASRPICTSTQTVAQRKTLCTHRRCNFLQITQVHCTTQGHGNAWQGSASIIYRCVGAPTWQADNSRHRLCLNTPTWQADNSKNGPLLAKHIPANHAYQSSKLAGGGPGSSNYPITWQVGEQQHGI
jgi:hypothetical protein